MLTSSASVFRQIAIRHACAHLPYISFQQLGGINAIIYYAVFLFSNSLGLSSSLASLLSGLLFTWFFIASFIPWFLIDTLGRRPLLIGSVALMAGIFAVMTGLVHQVDTGASNATACGWGAVA